jgi:hypothetical protein
MDDGDHVVQFNEELLCTRYTGLEYYLSTLGYHIATATHHHLLIQSLGGTNSNSNKGVVIQLDPEAICASTSAVFKHLKTVCR